VHTPNRAPSRIAATLAVLSVACPVLASQSTAPASDAKAVAVAERVMEALGGWKAWEATRFLRFDFAVERDGKALPARSHTWDKHTGRYRLEGQTQEGDPFVVLMNVTTKEGTAWRKGERVEGEEAAKMLERGYGAWVNDTYWLLMPYKMRDPGVTLSYDGEAAADGKTWDKVVLSFADVGLTPKDKYWVYVDRATGLVDRWEYILKGGPGPATRWDWKGWQRYGAVMLAPERLNPKDGARIHFPTLEVLASVPDSTFTEP
jgi:hypothetical protein